MKLEHLGACVCVFTYSNSLYSELKHFHHTSTLKMCLALRQVYLGQGLSMRQRLRVWSVGRKTISGPTNSLSHPPLTQAVRMNSFGLITFI